MPQSSFALLTNKGRQKEAAALANATAVVITHIAIGDGATIPSGGETTLYNEVDRKTISGQGVVSGASNVAYADIYLAAADGPYTIREAGLIDQDGDLIAIAHYDPPISKPTPDSGQTVEGTIRLEVAFTDLAVVTIKVDPSMAVALQRLSVLPWIPIKANNLATPPASPAIGDTYVIAAGASGSWATHSGKVAEYTLAGWAIITPKDGHGVGLPDGRIFIRKAGVYVEVIDPAFRARVANADIPVIAWQAGLPESETEGDRYVIYPGATGAWAGQVGKIATWVGGAWAFSSPVAGLQAQYWDGRQVVIRYDGADWAEDLATETAAGRVELSSNEETQTGTDGVRAVTPKSLSARTALTTRSGLVTLATEQDVIDAVGEGALQAKWLKYYARKQTVNLTFYVRLDGSDANSGLLNTAGGAFRTLQGAITSIRSRFSPSGYTITINVGAGSGFGAAVVENMPGFRLYILGSGTATLVDKLTVVGPSFVTIRQLKFIGLNGQIEARDGAYVEYGDIDFTRTGGYNVFAWAHAIIKHIAYSIFNNEGASLPQAAYTASTNGIIDLSGASINLNGIVPYSIAFAYCSAGQITAGGFGYSGSVPNAKRYAVNIMGSIYTGTVPASETHFPGDQAGSASLGGGYY